MKLKLGQSTIDSIYINNLALKLEAENPNLNFFEVNKLVKEVYNARTRLYSKPKVRIVK